MMTSNIFLVVSVIFVFSDVASPSQHIDGHIAGDDGGKTSGMGCVAERVVHSPKPKHRVACRIVRVIGTRKIATGITLSYVAQLWRHLFKL